MTLLQPDLRNADYSRQNLRSRSFMFADLRGANFSDCDLTGADFRWADLRDACFVSLEGAKRLAEQHLKSEVA